MILRIIENAPKGTLEDHIVEFYADRIKEEEISGSMDTMSAILFENQDTDCGEEEAEFNELVAKGYTGYVVIESNTSED